MSLIASMAVLKFSFTSLALMVSPLVKVCGITAAGIGLIARVGAATAIKRNAM
jgi:hypothetical protein